MPTIGRAQIVAEIDEIDRQLALPAAARVQLLIEGPKSMARLTDANLRAFEAHVDRLTDPDFAEAIINDRFGQPNRLFVE